MVFASSAAAFVLSGALLSIDAQPVASRLAARGATRVPVLSVRLTNACESAPVDVSEVVIKHAGLGSVQDIAAVSLLQDGRRIASSVHIDRRVQTATFRVRQRLEACASVTWTVTVAIATDASPAGQHVFSLQTLRAATGGNEGEYSATESEKTRGTFVAPIDRPGPTVTPRDLLRRISYGSGRTVYRFLLTGTAEDLLLDALSLHNAGSARDADLQNFRIVTSGGRVVSDTVPSMDGKDVRMTFSTPLLLERGQERLLEVLADVRASIRKTVRLQLEEAGDIEWHVRGR